MCWRIFILSYKKSTIAWEHWNRFCLRQCYFVLKSVWFQHSKFSKVAKMIYNSISDVCLVVFVPNLALDSIEFDQIVTLCKLNNFSHLPQWLTTLWLPAVVFTYQQAWKFWVVESSKLCFFWQLYEFNIYLFFKKRGRWLLERGTIGRIMVGHSTLNTLLDLLGLHHKVSTIFENLISSFFFLARPPQLNMTWWLLNMMYHVNVICRSGHLNYKKKKIKSDSKTLC